MKISVETIVKRGETHLNWCEDSLFEYDGNLYQVAGVFDGCSTGSNSHFSSHLFVKIFESTLESTEELQNSELFLQKLLTNFANRLSFFKDELELETNELLSTIILLAVNKQYGNGTIVVIGDGYYAIDSNITEIDQDNKPDYLAYSLSEARTDISQYLKVHAHIKNFEDFNSSLAISTDGIDTFDLTFKSKQIFQVEVPKTQNAAPPKPAVVAIKGIEDQKNAEVIKVAKENLKEASKESKISYKDKHISKIKKEKTKDKLPLENKSNPNKVGLFKKIYNTLFGNDYDPEESSYTEIFKYPRKPFYKNTIETKDWYPNRNSRHTIPAYSSTYANATTKTITHPELDVKEFFLVDKKFINFEGQAMNRKMKFIKSKYKAKHYDDIAVVRIIKINTDAV